MIPFRFEKVAVFDAGQDVGFNTSKDEGYGSIPIAAGAAKVPGLSVHCLRCGKAIKEGMPKCPFCGTDTRSVAQTDNPSADGQDPQQVEQSPAGDTGGEAAVEQDRSRGAYVGLGKYANLLQPALGGAAMVGSGVLGAKLMPMFSTAQKDARRARAIELVQQGKLPESELQKFARSGANPILNIRLVQKAIHKASGKIRGSVVQKGK